MDPKKFNKILQNALLSPKKLNFIPFSSKITKLKKNQNFIQLENKTFEKTKTQNLFFVSYNQNLKKYVFREIENLFLEKNVEIKDLEDAQFKIVDQIDFQDNESEFKDISCLETERKSKTEIEYEIGLKNKLMKYFEMIKWLKKEVIFNTNYFFSNNNLDFLDTNNKLDTDNLDNLNTDNLNKLEILTFLQSNTHFFKGRRIINNSFYKNHLHPLRNKILKEFDSFSVHKCSQKEYWLWDELHEYKREVPVLKGYSEKESMDNRGSMNKGSIKEKEYNDTGIDKDRGSININNTDINNLNIDKNNINDKRNKDSVWLDMNLKLNKMISLDKIKKRLNTKPENIILFLEKENLIKLSNNFYTRKDSNNLITDQIIKILEKNKSLRKKDVSYEDEGEFKEIVREFCEFKKGAWRIKEDPEINN